MSNLFRSTGRVTLWITIVSVLSLCISADLAYGSTSLEFEAETMKKVSGRGGIFSDATASDGKGLLRITPGTVYKSIASGQFDRVSVRARGDRCAGAPSMRLTIDGVPRKSWPVVTKRWTNYSADLETLPEGNHTIALQYFKDRERSRSCDRRLRVDKVDVVSKQNIEPPSSFADKPDCERSLQSLIGAAAPGSVVSAPGGCVYRESVVIDKPITLEAEPGAEIRGSEVWSEWQRQEGYWKMGQLPFLPAGESMRCKEGTSQCLWPEQVFFDGQALRQVASRPSSGEFAVDESRNVILADDPRAHKVEVSTRQQWVTARADNVTVRGFTMRHAANRREFGAITNRHDGGVHYHHNWTIEDNQLYDAHAAVVVLKGRDTRLLDNEISRGGQLGVHGSGQRILMRGNEIHHNNTEGFDPGWEAGGVKVATKASMLTVDQNEVYENEGPGVWCDGDCSGVIYSGNRVHHNARSGLLFEISDGAKIFGNVVWENGWGTHSRAYNPGISVEGSKNVEVYDNVVAWNAGGISVIHMQREEPRWNIVENVSVHNNTVLAKDGPGLRWIQQENWAGGMMDSPIANNRGYGNRYWYASPEGPTDRFGWTTTRFGKLSAFNDTPGEQGGLYITDAEKAQVVSSKGIPASPESRP